VRGRFGGGGWRGGGREARRRKGGLDEKRDPRVLLLAWSFLAEAEARVPAGAIKAAFPTSENCGVAPNSLSVAVLVTLGVIVH